MYVFFHIPKTAGVSVREFVAYNMEASRILVLEGSNDLAFISDDHLNSYDLISGHVGTRLLQRLRGRPITITFLRDPVGRVISQYQQFCALGVQEVRGRTLEDVMTDRGSPMIESLFRNTQCWALAGDHWVTNRPLVTEEEAFEVAKANLETMDYVGVVESIDECAEAMATKFGWRVRQIEHKNASPLSQYFDLDDGTLGLIREQNSLDIDLYEYWLRKTLDTLPGDDTAPGLGGKRAYSHGPDNSVQIREETADLRRWALRAEQLLNEERARTKELQCWAERAEQMLADARRETSELCAWAEKTEEFLAMECEKSQALKQWAERTENFLAMARKEAEDNRAWAERTEKFLHEERRKLQALKNMAERVDEPSGGS